MASIHDEEDDVGERFATCSLSTGYGDLDGERLKQRLLIKREDLEVDKYFRALVKLEGSDLHMKVGRPPMIRSRNELRPLNRPPIDNDEMMSLLLPMMNERM